MRERTAAITVCILPILLAMICPSRPCLAGQGTTDSSLVAKGPDVERQYKGLFDPIGPFAWRDLNGREFTDRDFGGRVLIVVQWAAWCSPCIDGFPDVQKLFRKVRRDASLAFVSVNMDRDLPAIAEFLKEFRKEYSFPVLLGGEHLRLRALPCTWIVDREGYIREVVLGSGKGWLERVQELVEAVKHRPSVSTLPPEILTSQRQKNQQEASQSR